MALHELLNSTATVERLSGTGQDSYGQPVQTWTAVATTVCRIQPVRRTQPEIVGPDNQAVTSTHTAFLPAGVDVRPRDRLVSSGISYAVLFVRDAAGAGHHLELDLEKIEPCAPLIWRSSLMSISGGYLEAGTRKMAARPYLYLAFLYHRKGFLKRLRIARRDDDQL